MATIADFKNEYAWANQKDDATLAKDFNAMDEATKATYSQEYRDAMASYKPPATTSASTGVVNAATTTRTPLQQYQDAGGDMSRAGEFLWGNAGANDPTQSSKTIAERVANMAAPKTAWQIEQDRIQAAQWGEHFTNSQVYNPGGVNTGIIAAATANDAANGQAAAATSNAALNTAQNNLAAGNTAATTDPFLKTFRDRYGWTGQLDDKTLLDNIRKMPAADLAKYAPDEQAWLKSIQNGTAYVAPTSAITSDPFTKTFRDRYSWTGQLDDQTLLNNIKNMPAADLAKYAPDEQAWLKSLGAGGTPAATTTPTPAVKGPVANQGNVARTDSTNADGTPNLSMNDRLPDGSIPPRPVFFSPMSAAEAAIDADWVKRYGGQTNTNTGTGNNNGGGATHGNGGATYGNNNGSLPPGVAGPTGGSGTGVVNSVTNQNVNSNWTVDPATGLPKPPPDDTINPVLAEVQQNQTVSGQLGDILKSGNPLIEAAKARAIQAANQRGLQNTSMAAQGAEEAMNASALEVAKNDSAVYQKQALTNQAIANEFLSMEKGKVIDLQKAYAQFQQNNYRFDKDDKLKLLMQDNQISADFKIAALKAEADRAALNQRLEEIGLQNSFAAEQLTRQQTFTTSQNQLQLESNNFDKYTQGLQQIWGMDLEPEEKANRATNWTAMYAGGPMPKGWIAPVFTAANVPGNKTTTTTTNNNSGVVNSGSNSDNQNGQ